MLNVGDYVVYFDNKIYRVTNIINTNSYEISYYQTPADVLIDDEELEELLKPKLVSLLDIMTTTTVIPKNDEEKVKKLFTK
jgi:hypothetical protein